MIQNVLQIKNRNYEKPYIPVTLQSKTDESFENFHQK